MDIRKINDNLSVSPQIAISDLNAVAEAGFRSVISNRPDGETEDQSTAAEIKAAAEAAGLTFAHVPVVGGQISDADIETFRETLDALPAPVLGFCRTGTRSTTLWSLANAKKQPVDQLIATAGEAGYDLNGLRPRLETLAG